MPERLAVTDPYKQVSEMVGSGPYKYIASERVPGSLVVYERNTKYVARPNGTPSGTAGPKIAYIDRIEWHIIPDPSTVAGALQNTDVTRPVATSVDTSTRRVSYCQIWYAIVIEIGDRDRLRKISAGKVCDRWFEGAISIAEQDPHRACPTVN